MKIQNYKCRIKIFLKKSGIVAERRKIPILQRCYAPPDPKKAARAARAAFSGSVAQLRFACLPLAASERSETEPPENRVLCTLCRGHFFKSSVPWFRFQRHLPEQGSVDTWHYNVQLSPDRADIPHRIRNSLPP